MDTSHDFGRRTQKARLGLDWFMKPKECLSRVVTEEGGELVLYVHDGDYSISYNGHELMHSRASASETLLGVIGAEAFSTGLPAKCLIGGLGLGYTLREILNRADEKAEIESVELLPEVVDWNRTYLKKLNGSLLADPRSTVTIGDIREVIRSAKPRSYDAILIDVDNGPTPLVLESNQSLYSNNGLRLTWRALRVGGRAVFWSAGPDNAFEKRLNRNGFSVSKVPAKVHEGAKRAAYLLFVAVKVTS